MTADISYHKIRLWLTVLGAFITAVALLASGVVGTNPGSARYRVRTVTDVSAGCTGRNAEVQQAIDRRVGYVYEAWTGCHGIGFARSLNGGMTYETAVTLPGSASVGADDPSVAVAADGTVYAAFMVHGPEQSYPVLAASFDHGASFPQVTSLRPPGTGNWGDIDMVTVGLDGTVYVTWDYGPSQAAIKYLCARGGSCSFADGDLNVVIQSSTDRGRTFGPIWHVSPGFPAGGADSGPLVVEPDGRIDLLYQGYTVIDRATDKLGPAYTYFTSSSDGGRTWTAPVRVGAAAGTMSPAEWWVDGDVAIDSAGNLYATWDTQDTNASGGSTDTGWLAYSTDHGQHWSAPIRVSPDRTAAPHITEVAGGRPGLAYVAWISSSDQRGYAPYVRTFSIKHRWRSPATRLSSTFDDPSIWPGDTFGLSELSAHHLILSWGGAPLGTAKVSHITAADVAVTFR
jgi:hypothetical protein